MQFNVEIDGSKYPVSYPFGALLEIEAATGRPISETLEEIGRSAATLRLVLAAGIRWGGGCRLEIGDIEALIDGGRFAILPAQRAVMGAIEYAFTGGAPLDDQTTPAKTEKKA